MAKFSFYGSDGLQAEFSKLERPPQNVISDMLKAMGNVAAKAQRKAALEQGIFDEESSVHIVDVVTVNKPKLTEDGGTVQITFKGTRKRGDTKTRNAEIAFVNEFGKRGQKARPFIAPSLRANEAKINEAAQAVYNDWADSQN